MGQRHKHADTIVAWANGAEIQYFSKTKDTWLDCHHWPSWDEFMEYRIKPETILYRVALMRGSEDTWTTTTNNKETKLHEGESFVCWLTDWVEVRL